jgi:hypothetical protein
VFASAHWQLLTHQFLALRKTMWIARRPTSMYNLEHRRVFATLSNVSVRYYNYLQGAMVVEAIGYFATHVARRG